MSTAVSKVYWHISDFCCLQALVTWSDGVSVCCARCGEVGFEVPMAETSKARNILEEIVW